MCASNKPPLQRENKTARHQVLWASEDAWGPGTLREAVPSAGVPSGGDILCWLLPEPAGKMWGSDSPGL